MISVLIILLIATNLITIYRLKRKKIKKYFSKSFIKSVSLEKVNKIFESEKISLNYNLQSLFTNLIIINNLTVENPKFFIEVVRKSSIEISPYKTQEMYNDNIGEVKKIVKTTPSKIWPEKDRDINFLILKVKINGAKAFIKTFLSPTITKVNLSDVYFSKVGNGWQMGSYIHHKNALKKIYYSVLAKISDLELKNFLKKLYNL